MFERKKSHSKKNIGKRCYMTKPLRHSKIQDTKRFKRIKNQELNPFGNFVTKVLIFRSSRSQMFFKVGVLKNFAILEPLLNKVADLLLQNTYGGWIQIFVAANTFFQLNLVFIADSRTGFCSGLLRKPKLNLRSRHWSC